MNFLFEFFMVAIYFWMAAYALWIGYFVVQSLRYSRMRNSDPIAAEEFRKTLEEKWGKSAKNGKIGGDVTFLTWVYTIFFGFFS